MTLQTVGKQAEDFHVCVLGVYNIVDLLNGTTVAHT